MSDRRQWSGGFVFVAFSTLCASAAQLLFRYVMQQYDPLVTGVALNWQQFAATGPTGIPWLLVLGLGLYALSMLSWLFALSRFDVSLAYPLLSLSYVIVYVAATCLPYFDESASPLRIAGVALITLGVGMLVTDTQSSQSREYRVATDD